MGLKMRLVIQRVTQAAVRVGEEIVGEIGKGLMVLVGINRDDTVQDAQTLSRKLVNLRLFDSPQGKGWDKSVKDLDLEVLLVSQFTLYGILKGNKPDFHLAMGSQTSEQFYNDFVQMVKDQHRPEKIQEGRFGAMMNVSINNDGPVTMVLDSRK